MNETEIKEALKIIKQPITVNCTDYKYFDEENYNKLISVYENCLWFIRNFEQINITVEQLQQKNQQLKERINQLDDDFMACVEEKCEIAEEYDKALQILADYYPPCEKDNFMDKNIEYCSINCGVDEEVFKECWRRYIKQELEKGISNE